MADLVSSCMKVVCLGEDREDNQGRDGTIALKRYMHGL